MRCTQWISSVKRLNHREARDTSRLHQVDSTQNSSLAYGISVCIANEQIEIEPEKRQRHVSERMSSWSCGFPPATSGLALELSRMPWRDGRSTKFPEGDTGNRRRHTLFA